MNDICINDIWIVGVEFKKINESISVYKEDTFIFNFNPNRFNLRYLKLHSHEKAKCYALEKRGLYESI